jgi:hypothetical protein
MGADHSAAPGTQAGEDEVKERAHCRSRGAHAPERGIPVQGRKFESAGAKTAPMFRSSIATISRRRRGAIGAEAGPSRRQQRMMVTLRSPPVDDATVTVCERQPPRS